MRALIHIHLKTEPNVIYYYSSLNNAVVCIIMTMSPGRCICFSDFAVKKLENHRQKRNNGILDAFQKALWSLSYNQALYCKYIFRERNVANLLSRFLSKYIFSAENCANLLLQKIYIQP